MTATASNPVTSRRTTLSRAYRDGLAEEMERDPSILVMGTDLYERGGHWAQVTGLGPQFGRDRVRNTPISEAAMVAAGVGAALDGLRPVVDLNFADFAFGAMDEIVNQAAKVRYWWNRPVPLVIRGTTGFAGGGAQHNNSLEAWFCHVPGLLVAMPSTPADAKGLIKTALRGEDPVGLPDAQDADRPARRSSGPTTWCPSARPRSGGRAPTLPWRATGSWWVRRCAPPRRWRPTALTSRSSTCAR
jgi:pyruvate dehydrogenase E1 component beta subunit